MSKLQTAQAVSLQRSLDGHVDNERNPVQIDSLNLDTDARGRWSVTSEMWVLSGVPSSGLGTWALCFNQLCAHDSLQQILLCGSRT